MKPIINKLKNITNYNYNYIFIALIIVLATFLKVPHLVELSIYGDEAFSVFHSQQTLSELFDRLLKDTNPPLYFAILHYWIALFGIGVVYVKALSVLFSIGTSVMLFVLANKHLNKVSAVFVSIMYLFSDIHFDYSHQVRAFSMVLFLCSVSIYLFLEISTTKKKKLWIILSIVNLALLFTHYLTAFFIVSQAIFSLFLFKNNKKACLNILYSYILSFILFLPWVGVVINNLPEAGSFWLETVKYKDLKYALEKLAEDKSLRDIYLWISLISLPLIVINTKVKIFEEKFKPSFVFMLLIYTFIPIGLCYWVSLYSPAFQFRYILYCSLTWLLLIGYLIGSLNLNVWIKLLITIPFFTYQIKHFHPKDRGVENWSEAIQRFNTLKTENTISFITAGYKSTDFSYYYNPNIFKNYNSTEELLEKDNIYPIYTSFDFDKIGWSNYNKVLLIQSHHLVVDKENSIEQYLSNKFEMCKVYGTDKSVKTIVFVKKGNKCDNFETLKKEKANKDICEKWDITFEKNKFNSEQRFIFSSDMEYKADCDLRFELSNNFAVSDSLSNLISSKEPFSLTLDKNVTELKEVNIQASLYLEQECNAVYVVSLEKAGKPVFREDMYFGNLIKTYNQWSKINLGVVIPSNITGEYKLKIYVWNEKECDVFLDDITYSLTANKVTDSAI